MKGVGKTSPMTPEDIDLCCRCTGRKVVRNKWKSAINYGREYVWTVGKS
jgi:hypothetical protein